MMQRILVAILCVPLLAQVMASDEYPRLKLDNDVIQVSIFLPDAEQGYYRGTRFDWSGVIERVDYGEHRFYGPLHESHDPTKHDSISGPADEFAMFHPMGYAEAEPGQSFVKIGVGLLARSDSSDYRFHGRYDLVQAGDWKVESDTDRVSFIQDLVAERGWAYRYRKTIRLLSHRPELVIDYRLENRGQKVIDISHYNHNFTIIDGSPYGPDYSVEFPFSTTEPIPINDLAWFRDNRIEVESPLGDDSLWISVFEGKDPGHYNGAKVRNQTTGASVEFRGDTPITRMVFWAVERAACPEPFIHIHLAPGQVKTWSIHYRFDHDKD